MFLKSLFQAALALPLLYNTASAQQSQTACNNSPSLCQQPYNNITHLGAHNSPFLRDQTTSFSTSGNQYYNTRTQLENGVRLLSAQVHKVNNSTGQNAWHLCHGDCDFLDAGTLVEWLEDIKSWMDVNTNEVVTLILVNADNASPSDLGASFKSSGIDKMAYSPPSLNTRPETWPTLQSLISNNTRLMTFVASLPQPSEEFPYLMDEFTFIFENDFENESPTDYSCNPHRPSGLGSSQAAAETGRMFFMNHFLYQTQLFGIQSPNDTYLDTTNGRSGLGSLGDAIQSCTRVYSKPPTFVLVDFWNVGPAISSIDRANGISNPVGRQSVPAERLEETTSGVSRPQESVFAVVVAVLAAISFGL